MDVDVFLVFDGDGGTDDDDNDNDNDDDDDDDGDDGDADGDDGDDGRDGDDDELLFGDAVFFLFSDVVDLHDPIRRVDLLGVLRLDILFIHIIKSPNDKKCNVRMENLTYYSIAMQQ